MNRPLVGIGIAFCCGIVFAAYARCPFWLGYAGAMTGLFAASMSLRRKYFFPVCLWGACFFLGIAVLVQSRIVPAGHISLYTPYKGVALTLQGTVVSEPRQYKKNISFVFRTEQLSTSERRIKVNGNVLVRCFLQKDIRYGQKLVCRGTLYRPYSRELFSRLNYRDFLRQRGIYAMFAVGKSGAVDIIGERKGFRRGIIAVKKRMEAVLNRRLPRSSAGMLNAMILGGRSEAPKYINTALQRTGTVHILAVSGLHVGIVAFIVLAGLKLLAMPYRWRYATAMIILLGYCFLTGARIPIVRATIMAEVLLAGVLLFRSYDPLSALSLAACLILIVCPQQLFDVGFQLSFISVFSIMVFYKAFDRILPASKGAGAVPRFLIESFFLSLTAWIGIAGVVAYYFHLVTPVAIIANMIIVPLLFLIVANGFILLISAGLVPFVSGVLAENCTFFIGVLYTVNAWLLKIPGAYFEFKTMPLWPVYVYYAGLLLLFNLRRIKEWGQAVRLR